METSEQIPTVAVHDLRLMWNVRQEFPKTAVDIHVIQPLATEGADLVAAGLRADLLWMIVLKAPDAFESLLDQGQPCNVLFDCFAQVPIQLGAQFDLGGFLNTLKQQATERSHE